MALRGDERYVAQNRRARHDYLIENTLEAGMMLTGTEVKALRAGLAHLREGYVRVENGEAWLIQVNIGQYEMGNRQNHEAERRRRLLLHRREIQYLDSKVRQGGLALVPLRLYVKHNRIKCEIAVARGKKLWDKRQAIAERDARRDVERATAHALRG